MEFLSFWLEVLAVAVAIRTFRRGGSIKHHVLAGHYARQLVARFAGHILVSALNGKCRPGIVVKVSRLPPIHVMATGAVRDIPAACKLPCMGIVMATGALHGRRLKVHVFQRSFQVRRTMAISTSDSSMRPQ